MNWMKRSSVVLLLSFFVCFGLLGVYTMSIDVAEGESVGEGWHLLKKNEVTYEEMNGQKEMVSSSMEVGSGPINISLIASVVVAFGYVLVGLVRQKEVVSN
ncbi:hypothetical protein LF817_14280 [Halobacillus sp. A1]|uniref:hypothetical protein n=1 Tax=Halobacillus sp. A1 TaxID=2880262 RepID=UPI0020A6BD56|nr:hypothetical protein [Halobacillus sp. A1]MCP3032491.1 hypothetical protein [Halobacillus sp. A1]